MIFPQVPSGEVLTFGDDNFVQYEEAGVREARKAAFVLVAGGLGERLGYNGIKVKHVDWLFMSISALHDSDSGCTSFPRIQANSVFY